MTFSSDQGRGQSDRPGVTRAPQEPDLRLCHGYITEQADGP